MTDHVCRFEPAVRRAVLEQSWPAGLQEHAAECADCQETILALEAMQVLSARSAGIAQGVPPYRLVWLRAQRARAQKRAAQRRRFYSLVSVGLVVVIAGLHVLARSGTPDFEMSAVLGAPFADAGALFAGGIPAAAGVVLLVLALVWMDDLRRYGA